MNYLLYNSKSALLELLKSLHFPFSLFSQVWHIIAQSAVCYCLMKWAQPAIAHKLVFLFAMGYLSCMHIYRQYYDYGGYTMDITG